MKRKNGFTLVELLAVIVLLGILITVAVPAVLRSLEGAVEETDKKAREYAMDAALTYGISKLKLPSCANGFVPTNESSTSNAGCLKKVTVKFLKDNAYFTDNAENCKENAEILIYNYYLDNGVDKVNEYRVWAPDDICS